MVSNARLDRYRRIANSKRRLPGEHGLRPYAVEVVQATWSGSYPGHGGKLEVVAEVFEHSQNPKVRFLDEEQRALADLTHGAAEIGPITPDHSQGGTALSELLPEMAQGTTLQVRLTGPAYPDGALFYIKKVTTDRALRWMLTVEPVEKERFA